MINEKFEKELYRYFRQEKSELEESARGLREYISWLKKQDVIKFLYNNIRRKYYDWSF